MLILQVFFVRLLFFFHVYAASSFFILSVQCSDWLNSFILLDGVVVVIKEDFRSVVEVLFLEVIMVFNE
jgi:hypothetical protein